MINKVKDTLTTTAIIVLLMIVGFGLFGTFTRNENDEGAFHIEIVS